MTRMPTPRIGFSLVRFEDKIFAFGGHSNLGTLSTIDIYYPKIDKWEINLGISLPDERSWLGTAILNNKIYIMGGTHRYDGQDLRQALDGLKDVYEYTMSSYLVNPQDKITSTWGNIKAIK